jgi:hypothetical protein
MLRLCIRATRLPATLSSGIQGQQPTLVVFGQRKHARLIGPEQIGPARCRMSAHQSCGVAVVLQADCVPELMCNDIARDVREIHRREPRSADSHDPLRIFAERGTGERNERRVGEHDRDVPWQVTQSSRNAGRPTTGAQHLRAQHSSSSGTGCARCTIEPETESRADLGQAPVPESNGFIDGQPARIAGGADDGDFLARAAMAYRAGRKQSRPRGRRRSGCQPPWAS